MRIKVGNVFYTAHLTVKRFTFFQSIAYTTLACFLCIVIYTFIIINLIFSCYRNIFGFLLPLVDFCVAFKCKNNAHFIWICLWHLYVPLCSTCSACQGVASKLHVHITSRRVTVSLSDSKSRVYATLPRMICLRNAIAMKLCSFMSLLSASTFEQLKVRCKLQRFFVAKIEREKELLRI